MNHAVQSLPLNLGWTCDMLQPTDSRSDSVPVVGVSLKKTYQLSPKPPARSLLGGPVEKPQGKRGPEIIWKERKSSHPGIPAEPKAH